MPPCWLLISLSSFTLWYAQLTFDALPPSLVPKVDPVSVFVLLLRATQEELQRGASPAAETPPLQRRPSVRAAISTLEPSSSRGRPQVAPIPETEEARRLNPACTSSNADPTSPDLGPRGPELAGLQAERDVVSMRERHQLRGKDSHDNQVRLGLEGETQERDT